MESTLHPRHFLCYIYFQRAAGIIQRILRVTGRTYWSTSYAVGPFEMYKSSKSSDSPLFF